MFCHFSHPVFFVWDWLFLMIPRDIYSNQWPCLLCFTIAFIGATHWSSQVMDGVNPLKTGLCQFDGCGNWQIGHVVPVFAYHSTKKLVAGVIYPEVATELNWNYLRFFVWILFYYAVSFESNSCYVITLLITCAAFSSNEPFNFMKVELN